MRRALLLTVVLACSSKTDPQPDAGTIDAEVDASDAPTW